MTHSSKVVWSVESGLCIKKCVQRDEVHFPRADFQLNAPPLHFIVVSDTENGTETVEDAEISLDVEILQAATKLRGQVQGDVGTVPVHRVKIGDCGLDTHQIFLGEQAADVHILRQQWNAMRHDCKTTHENKLHFRAQKAVHQ